MTKQVLIKNLLEKGRFTAIDLNRRVRTGDARKIISRLRAYYRDGINGGADVQDEWRYRSDGVRYKVYWISQHLTTKGGEHEK